MKSANVSQLKNELKSRKPDELLELCLRLAKFKKENKELLTYLLFEADNEDAFVENIKREISHEFTLINTNSYFYIKKSIRRILRNIKKYIRYSKKRETEVELLMYFCFEIVNMEPSFMENTVLQNIYSRQLEAISKAISYLHEDLQYDYQTELEEIKSINPA